MDAFYMARGDVQYGPFTEAKIKELIERRRLVGTDLVWFAGQAAWRPAAEVLGAWLSTAAPVPPPLPAMMPPPIPQQAVAAAASAQPSLDMSSAQLGAAASNVSTPVSPWAKHAESLKSVVGTDKLIDPKRIADSLTQAFQPATNSQAQMSDVSHEVNGGYGDAEHDDEEDDED